MTQKKRYLVTVVYPCEVEENEEVTWIEVKAANPKQASKKAQQLAAKWIKTPKMREINENGVGGKEIYDDEY